MSYRTLSLALILLALAAPAAAQRPAGPPAQRPGPQAAQRRALLEAQLLQRFAQQAGRELRLQDAEQARLTRIVQDVAVVRRQLNVAAVDLRRRLGLAIRDSATTDADFERLLEEQRALREREHQLWQREQARLQQILTPRQRAHFTHLWLRLQDDARGLMMQRGSSGPVGPRAPGL